MEHKEVLTNEQIKTDLYRMVTWWDIALHIVLVALTLFIFGACFRLYYVGFILLGTIPSGFLLFVSIALTIDVLIRFFRYRPAAVSGKYHVSVDTMTHIQPLFYDQHQAYICFSKHKPFKTNKSSRYSMKSEKWNLSRFQNSSEGDTFYIVTADGKTPLTIYNTKFFEYVENEKDSSV